MALRDQIEQTLRSWNAHELARGAAAVIDYDCHPQDDDQAAEPADRLTTYRALTALRQQADETPGLAQRIDAHLCYLRAVMGERPGLDDYIYGTQGCHARGWPEPYIQQTGDTLRASLDDLGVTWSAETRRELEQIEEPVDRDDAPAAIRDAAEKYEPQVRAITGSAAPLDVTIETAHVDAYWAFWTDGSGPAVRLRLNFKEVQFTEVQARQFALHEILGHGLQGASYAHRAAAEPVPWVRLLSVHAPQQVLMEGLGQALPLFADPDDQLLILRVRLDHYAQLVRAALHVAINAGATVTQCANYARQHVPYWTDADIADQLTDRGASPLLRSYLWSYPAGIDWFTHLAQAPAEARSRVLQAAYRDPLTPEQMAELWPEGPAFGGPGPSPSVG